MSIFLHTPCAFAQGFFFGLILSGLIKQNSGQLRIDNESIEEHNLQDWQKLLGFVPQNIFLTTKTIKENIAFGINKNNIDDKKVKNSQEISKQKIKKFQNFQKSKT